MNGTSSTRHIQSYLAPKGTNHASRRMMCSPESLSTMPEISPTSSAKDASSNGFCICPGPKWPRSPPLLYEEQSDLAFALAAKALCGSSLERISAL